MGGIGPPLWRFPPIFFSETFPKFKLIVIDRRKVDVRMIC